MRFTIPYKWYRLMGIIGLSLLIYIIVIGIFGNVDISRFLPMKLAASIQDAWPRLPFFRTETESIDQGRGEIIYYTVPTRQFSSHEVAQMIGTNHTAHPSAPTARPSPAAR
ncbi:MAG: hypothetical protein LV479_05370 [Methylacidiphilales bacterium]|nr:hypothetical protein [Candidatus Methylacidiphilales bacterium]